MVDGLSEAIPIVCLKGRRMGCATTFTKLFCCTNASIRATIGFWLLAKTAVVGKPAADS
jgi:hypothetical protein